MMLPQPCATGDPARTAPVTMGNQCLPVRGIRARHSKFTTPMLALLLCCLSGIAQKEANVWHFGHGQGLDFNSGEAVQITGAMSTYEGCTAYCDSMGNLLFYSNGGGRIPLGGQSTGIIWNRNHEIMYDMQGLEGGGWSAGQSSVIVPAPGEPDVYYLFTVDEVEHYVDATPEILALQPNGRGLRYFKIDMTLNDGLGEVTVADVEVYDYALEGLCAIRHANGSDYWILINQDTTGVGVYSVTPDGVALSSVFETEEPLLSSIKASPSTAIPGVACCHKVVASGKYLLDFDLETGILSNPETLPAVGSEAVEFSHNGFYLYSTLSGGGLGTQELVRYNLLTAWELDVSAVSTQEVIEPDITAYYMQLAPDHKIYFTWLNFQGECFVGSIDCPNNTAPSVTHERYNYGSDDDSLFFTLPNFSPWIFYSLDIDAIEFGPDTVFLCEGDSLILDAGVGNYWEWGGDCFSGPEETWPDNSTRFFTVTQPGTYVACVNGPCSDGEGAEGCSSSDQITVLPCPDPPTPCNLNLPDSLHVCAGDSLALEVDLSGLEGYTALQWSGGTGTFLPSDTVANPVYVPSAQDLLQGEIALNLEVFTSGGGLGDGRLVAYDHSGEDLIFYIDPGDGSIDSVQENTGYDWTAMGFREADCKLYGLSNIVVSPGLYSVDLSGENATLISTYDTEFYAGDYDNENDVFYAIGMTSFNGGEPIDQYLITINPNDGSLDTIGNLNIQGIDGFFYAVDDGINGLAYDSDLDILFALTDSGELFEVSTTDGSVTFVGNSQAGLRGLTYDEDADKLWGIGSTGTLYEIDKSTGEVVDNVPCQANLNFVTSLTFARPGCEEVESCAESITVVLHNETTLDTGSDTTLCAGTSLLLSVPGFEDYLWQDGSTDDNYLVTESGLYTVQATDAFGCPRSGDIQVDFEAVPDPDFDASPQPTTIENTELTFTASDTGEGLTYTWTFEQGDPGSAGGANPVVTFPQVPGSYTVTLVVENALGCTDSLTSVIIIGTDGQITMPNIFTPNNDGTNDRFIPFEEFPGTWELQVFNRWGEALFRTTNITVGWDGEDAPEGTYYWVLLPTGDQQGDNRSGYVQLVRGE